MSVDPYSALRVRMAWQARERARSQPPAILAACRVHLDARRARAEDDFRAALREAGERGATIRALAALLGTGRSMIGERRVHQLTNGTPERPMPCGCHGRLHDCEDFPLPAWARRYLAGFDPRAV